MSFSRASIIDHLAPSPSPSVNRSQLEALYAKWLASDRSSLSVLEAPALAAIHIDHSTPLLLLGASNGYGQHFIKQVIADYHVVGIVDNYRIGENFCGKIIKHDDDVPALIPAHRGLIAVNLTVGQTGTRHYEFLCRRLGIPCLSLMQALRKTGRRAVHFSMENLSEVALANFEQIMEASSLYADELSRQTLCALMLYRFTLDGAHLDSVNMGNDDLIVCPSLVALHDDEVFVDGGAFTGDTIDRFLGQTGGWYRKIHAFEPDPENYNALVRHTRSMRDVRVLQKGLHSATSTLRFSNMSSPGSHVDSAGNDSIETVALDEMMDDAVSFIKLNIEGSEVPALHGARGHLNRSRPRIALSADHFGDDLSTIPRALLEIEGSYKVYLRHHSHLPFGIYIYAVPG